MTAIDDLEHVHRAPWAAGDDAAVAEHIAQVPPSDLLRRVGVGPGQLLLDVAAGTRQRRGPRGGARGRVGSDARVVEGGALVAIATVVR